MSDTSDDSLAPLRTLGRLAMGTVLLLTLLFATLVVAHGLDDAQFLLCNPIEADFTAGPDEADPDGTAPDDVTVRPAWHWIPPSIDCVRHSPAGSPSTVRVSLSARATVAVWVLYVAWPAAAAAAIALLLRPERVRVLDHIAATLGLGLVVSVASLNMVMSAARNQAAMTPAPLRGPAGATLPGWRFAALLVCVAAGSLVAATRARRWRWTAAVAHAVVAWLFLVVSAMAHPVTPRLSQTVASGLAGGLVARLVRAVRRLAPADPDAASETSGAP